MKTIGLAIIVLVSASTAAVHGTLEPYPGCVALTVEHLLNEELIRGSTSQLDIRILGDLDTPAQVHLQMYDLRGHLVATLQDGPLGMGLHSLVWRPVGLSSGAYFYRLTAGSTVRTGRCLLAK